MLIRLERLSGVPEVELGLFLCRIYTVRIYIPIVINVSGSQVTRKYQKFKPISMPVDCSKTKKFMPYTV